MGDNLEKNVLELLTSHGTLASPDTLKFILAQDDPEEYLENTLKNFQEIPLFLTVDQLKAMEVSTDSTAQMSNPPEISSDSQIPDNSLQKEIPKDTNDEEPTGLPLAPVGLSTADSSIPETKKIVSKISSKTPLGKEFDSDIKILKDVTGQSTSEGTLKDFIKYFQTRFEKLRRILATHRREVIGYTNIARARNQTGPIKIIGLITSVRDTKQGHKIIELEDETDSISVLVLNSSPLIEMNFINDEVICVLGKMGKSDLVYVEDIIRPDIPFARKQNRSDVPISCIFMADTHVGSKTFLHEAWDKLIKWINGKYSVNGFEELRDRLKYIVVAGDLVDGIGVYPNQESELEIPDIYAQYENLALKFQEIPDYIQIIMQPGNHDAVRPAEPQPTFPNEITQLFSDNITFVGNPCYFAINNVEVLSYHGRSMDDFVMQIPNVSYNKPIQIMKEMLTRRHLAPVYGQRTPIAPEHEDYLIIEKLPDIFVTGHIHKTAFEQYRDISLINASAWQSQTTYQKMMNFNPDPGKIVLADLQSRKLNILNFA